MNAGGDRGPAWVGIGAQRAGTTWFTSLLTQHPEVSLGTGERKELHYFGRFLYAEWGPGAAQEYRGLFAGATGRLPGEFTPFYLRGLWIPSLLRQACPRDVVLVALLRDPVDRFASALRWYRQQPSAPDLASPSRGDVWARFRGTDALWGGMYATQLAVWRDVFGEDRLIVEQYERAVADPETALGRVWRALGVGSVPLHDVDERSRTTTATEEGSDVLSLPGLDDSLRQAYEPEVSRLEREWRVDRSLWPNFGPARERPISSAR